MRLLKYAYLQYLSLANIVIRCSQLLIIFLLVGCPQPDNKEPALLRTLAINWEYFEIGEPGDIFRDIAIINDSIAITVGHTHHDSEGYLEANGAIWNGTDLQVIDIYGINIENPRPAALESVFALNQSNYWAAGTSPRQYIDSTWYRYYSENSNWSKPFYVYSIWGRAEDDMYFGGEAGTLSHWDGNNFLYVNTGINTDIKSIKGNEETAFAVAWCVFGSSCSYTAILQQIDGNWDILVHEDNIIHDDDGENLELGRYYDVNVLGDTAYFLTDYAPIVKYNYKTEEWNTNGQYSPSAQYQYTMIAGNEWNNQLLLHEWTGGMAWFNGETVITDSSLINSYDFLPNTGWMDMEYDGQTVYVVGRSQAAFIAIGQVIISTMTVD